MLTLEIISEELFDEETSSFVPSKTFTLELEHSLVSLSKWESKFKKPFLGTEKTSAEMLWYVSAMVISDTPPWMFRYLTSKHIDAINEYIHDPMTATTFTERKQTSPKKDVITAEIIYYWMIASTIPFECQHWHLNRLLTLIRVCNIKNSPPKKMSREEIARQNRALNARRKQQVNTRG